MKIIITESQLKVLIENEEQIPDDVMRSIEAEADKSVADVQKMRAEKEELLRKIENAHKEGKLTGSVYDVFLQKTKDELDRLSGQDEEIRNRYINQLIFDYRREMAIKKGQEERAERTKTAKITREQIIDIFVTALEGGSNYWYYILDIPKEIKYMIKQEGLAFSEACGKYVLDGGELAIYDKEELNNVGIGDEDSDLETYSNKPEPLGYVNMDSLLDAIRVMKQDYEDRYKNIIMDEYDADDADIFFQLATMGEVVFG